MHNPLVYIIILAWNQKETTIECVNSFLATTYSNLKLLVVDNGSTDGTYEALTTRFPTMEIIRSNKNLGIAGGYNLGIQEALENNAEYVLVTNNDVIVATDLVTNLAEVLTTTPDVGMVMPKIYHYYGDKTRLWCTGGRWRKFPPGVKMMGYGIQDSEEWSHIKEIDYAPSCTLLIRNQLLSRLEGFDENYFFYNDDWDFSARLRAEGYRILFVPKAKVWHKVSISTQKSDRPEYWWMQMGYSSVLFYSRHVNLASLMMHITWFMLREILKLKVNRVCPYLKGVKQGFEEIESKNLI